MKRMWLGLALGAATLALVIAQDSWHTHRGSNQRIGTTTNARTSVTDFLLAWSLPDAGAVRQPAIIDNDNLARTSASPAGAWKIPSAAERASDPFLADPDTANPYQYIECVREPINPGDPVPNVAQFTWRSGQLRPGYYRVFVYVPTADTQLGGLPVPYARRAEYQVTDSLGATTTLFIDQQLGGWIPLGDTAFYHDGQTELRVVLNNLIRVNSPDHPLNITPIVAADAVRFVPDYGTVQASPVVIRSPLDPATHLVYIANGNGTITCMENPISTRGARVRWTLRVPDLPDLDAGQIYDDEDSNFTAGQFTSNDALADRYERLYHEIAPTNNPNNIQRAYWKIQVPQTGDYYVYAWFPSDPDNAQQAQYVIENEDGYLRLRIDQRFGGRWVLLNRTPVPMRVGRNYEIEVNNFSPADVTAGSARVIADAIRVVKADGLNNAVFSTPAVGRVRIRDGNSVVTRWVVFFGAQNGALYAVDALGDGENGTRRGQTKVYWIIKPDNSASFGYASPLVLEDEDLVAIGNTSGAVYLVNTDLNPNDRDTHFRWVYSRFGASFVSTPAYDPANRLLYIGSVEGGNQYGRLIALKPFVQDNPNTPNVDERVAWVYPPENQAPVEPITSTPAVALGRVYFTSGGVDGGRLYAVKADNGSLVWARPAIGAPLSQLLSFFYTSPLVVENVPYRGVPTNVVYVGATTLGRLLAFNADNGELLFISELLGGQIFGSPVYTTVRPRDGVGVAIDVPRPSVIVPVNGANLLALYADGSVTSDNRRAFEGWRMYSPTVFASPAVLDNWLYAADDEGIVYAYNVTGVANAGELGRNTGGTGGGDDDQQPDNSDYSKMRVSIVLEKSQIDDLIAGRIRPEELRPEYPKALEWGDSFYVVIWNFKHDAQRQTPKIEVLGPGGTSTVTGTALVQISNPPQADPNLDYIAWAQITIQPSGGNQPNQNIYTPGQGYTLRITDGRGATTYDFARETPALDRPRRGGGLEEVSDDPIRVGDIDLPVDTSWQFGVANPLGLRGIGEVGAGGPEQNLFNGNAPETRPNDPNPPTVNARFQTPTGPSPVGFGEHGKTTFGDFEVRDRRVFQTPTPVALALNARAAVDDLRWQGGAPDTLLPWEIPPTSFNNNSPDYPDISGRRIQMLFDGAVDLQRAPARPLTTGNRVEVQVEIPRFQPPSPQGYSSRTRVYVDLNGNGRFDILDNLTNVNAARTLRAEAYRDLSSTVAVQPDLRLFVEEQVIDFGALPGGFGFNWGALFPTQNGSAFRPDTPIFEQFWKPFTVRNEGNVNLFPVYLGKAFNNPQGTQFLFSDMVSFFAGMPAWTTVVSTLDARFWPQPSQFYPGGNQPYPILQKPQVGDYTSTVLTQPAVPPRRDPDIVVEPRKPLVAIAIPPFQPMGVYSQLIAPYRANPNGQPGVVAPGNPFATPPMRVVVRVRETQLTGGTNRGVIPMIDGAPNPNDPRVSDITPAAFRDPSTGRMHLYWASNRPDPANRPNSFYLYKATLDWNARNTLQDGVRATNGWRPESTSRWWGAPFGPYPNDPNGNLFSQALGLGRPLTDAEIATIKHHRPFIRQTGNAAFLFWTGEVILRNQKYELLFYVRLNPITGEPQGNPQAVPLDPVMPRSSLTITGVDGVGNWLFYVAAPSGRSQIFYIASEGALFSGWRREQRLPLSGIVRSVESVSANVYRVAANPNAANTNFLYLADVYFIGTVGDRAESEILMQRFYLNPRNGNLLPLSDSRADRSLGVTQERFLPLVVDEVAQKDPGQNVWRVRHLDWTPVDGDWNRFTPDLDIKINGVSILQQRNPNNPTQFILQQPVADAQTGLLQFTFNEPVLNGSGQIVNLLNRGQIIVDPTNGTVRFVNFAPRLNDVVTVTYRPRVYRILSVAPGSAGSYSQLRAVFQRTMNPRHDMDNPAESPVRRGVDNGACSISDRPPVDRVWLFFRRSGPAPNTTGNFFFKTLRPGVRLQSPVLTRRGRIPVQTGGFTLAEGTNHIVVRLTPNNVTGAGIGFYEYDPQRGNIYFTTDDIGKEVNVRYLARDRAGNIVELEETLTVRWIDEGNLARSFATDVEYTSPVPIDLPTNELYLWTMPNLEFRQPGSLLSAPYGGLDESLLLFWSSTRNGVGNIYGGAIQPRFYVSPFDPDAD